MRHLRQRTLRGRTRAWSPRIVSRIPRFRWKARVKCRRRFVFVRNPDESITMRRPICRAFRRMAWPSRGSKAA